MVTKPGNLNVRLPDDLARSIELYAKQLHLSKSDVVRMLLRSGSVPLFQQVQVLRG